MKRNLLLFISIFCSVALSAATLQEARAYVTAKQYPQAVSAYRSLLQQNPKMLKNADFCKFFGQSLCMTGAYEESISYLEQATRLNKTGAWWYLGISRQHLYAFDEALQALEKYKSTLQRNSDWLPRVDSIIAECQVGLKGVSHVEDVVIIDSMMVPAQAFFGHYMLGSESGRILAPSACGGAALAQAMDSTVTSVFENQTADYRLWASLRDGQYRLWESHLFAGEWGEPQVIGSLDCGSRQMCYPFLRSDSETLFFASDSTPGFGGLDIYKTHYNTETESYFLPERLGMPFNSPFNDFMLAIDETHQVGWWATDRHAAPGMVCIYIFQLEDAPRYLEGRQPERARVASIAATWRRKAGYEALIEEIKTAPQYVVEKEVIRIPISDAVVYSSPEQFRSAKAREAYDLSLRVEASLLDLKGQLDSMRQEYHSASAKRRKELKASILQAEERELQLEDQLQAAQKRYRNLELNGK